MKTHLFRPGEVITMCGIHLKSFSTKTPSDVTCKRCRHFYEGSVDWYWASLDLTVPVGERYINWDEPMFIIGLDFPVVRWMREEVLKMTEEFLKDKGA